jgi:predicted dehydrogenase
MKFHEMAGVAFARPYSSIRETIRSGAIGKVVQILAQKSYPWTERRPSDEDVDGGLGTQVAIYIPRFVEHVAGMKIASIEMVETRLGNPAPGHNCRMAVSVLMTLENGGVAVGVANYLNPIGSRVWGYEMLRVFGTGGVIESDPETGAVRLLAGGGEPAVVDAPPDGEDYFTLFAGSLLGQRTMPLTMEDELSPTRWIIRAKRAARLVR